MPADSLNDMVNEGLVGNYCRNSPTYKAKIGKINGNAPQMKINDIFCAYYP